MIKFNFTADELSELQALQVRGGAAGTPLEPMAQTECSNTKAGCGANVDQIRCTNHAAGCGGSITVHLGCSIDKPQDGCSIGTL